MKIIIFVLASSLFVLFSGIIGFLWWLMTPIDVDRTEIIPVVVQKGDTFASLASRLESQKVLRSARVMRFLLRGKPQATLVPGRYEVSATMSASTLVDIFLRGTQDQWVTLLEGWRTEEIAAALDKKLGEAFDPDIFEKLARESEGKLFPDTYLIPKDATSEYVLDLLLRTYSSRTKELTIEDEIRTLTLASLIQREAKGKDDMAMVAGILLNRLKSDMPLQVDASLQYAKGDWSTPKSADKDLPGPFNTYLNKGLPPHPICNPGLAAIQAALDPMKTDNLFYLHDKSGAAHYAKTYEEHQMNIEQYLR